MRLTIPVAIVVAAALLSLTLVGLFRYEIVTGQNAAIAARLNRLTGNISLCATESGSPAYKCR